MFVLIIDFYVHTHIISNSNTAHILTIISTTRGRSGGTGGEEVSATQVTIPGHPEAMAEPGVHLPCKITITMVVVVLVLMLVLAVVVLLVMHLVIPSCL